MALSVRIVVIGRLGVALPTNRLIPISLLYRKSWVHEMWLRRTEFMSVFYSASKGEGGRETNGTASTGWNVHGGYVRRDRMLPSTCVDGSASTPDTTHRE